MIMINLDKKIKVLCTIANLFNENDIIWAIGASGMLYFRGILDNFNDLDIMVDLNDIGRAIEIMDTIASRKINNSNTGFKTKYFFQYNLDSVEIDIISGMIISKKGIDYDCSLYENEIDTKMKVMNSIIYLQSVESWKRYYYLMGREDKYNLLNNTMPNNKNYLK